MAFQQLGLSVTRVKKRPEWSFAFMVLTTPDEMHRAFRFHRSMLAGRQISINPYNPSSKSSIIQFGHDNTGLCR